MKRSLVVTLLMVIMLSGCKDNISTTALQLVYAQVLKPALVMYSAEVVQIMAKDGYYNTATKKMECDPLDIGNLLTSCFKACKTVLAGQGLLTNKASTATNQVVGVLSISQADVEAAVAVKESTVVAPAVPYVIR